MNKLTVLTAVAASLMLPMTAEAAVTVKLTGYVYHVTSSVKSFFTYGQAASAWFSYDPASAGTAWYPGGTLDPNVYFYQNAPTGGAMTVGFYSVRFSDSARMFVTNQERSQQGLLDRVLFDDHDPQAPNLAGRAIDVVSISWQDNTATALHNLRLPSSPAAFAAFPAPRSSIDWTPYIGAEHRISIVFDTVVVVAGVPNPSLWAMLIVGFAAVGAAMRVRSGRKWRAATA